MKTRYFPSGQIMPAHIYPLPRPRKDGIARYRTKAYDGRWVIIPSVDEEEIISMGVAIANSRKQSAEEKIIIPGTLGDEFNKYVMADLAPRGHKSLGQSVATLRKYLQPFLKRKTNSITVMMLHDLWLSMSPHVQRAQKANLRRFFNGLILLNKVPNLQFVNPFNAPTAGGFECKPMPRKKRAIMRAETFVKIQDVAKAKGYQFLVDAMDIGLGTGLRLSDVLTLRLDGTQEGVIQKIISKSLSRTNTAPSRNMYGEDTFSVLYNIIKRSKSTLGKSTCPFIIRYKAKQHDNSKRQVEHPEAMHRTQINYFMNKCMDEIEEFRDVEAPCRPSFHEIRALKNHLDEMADIDLKDRSKSLGHSSEKVTLGSYNTHKEYNDFLVGWETTIPRH